ncbi:MAG: hypothetical protein JWO30_2152 [Fibrobacteres bacterium]|nr:hypothetical protein [Fibrobacterota bacterium]
MSQSVFSEVDRVIAIGDLHGNFAGFKRILQETGLVDKRGHWQARDTHLVQLGDILGRGGEPGKIFKLLKRLETEAPQFGSRVHLLLGNHEAMSMSGLVIYNTMEEFQDLACEDLLEEGARPLPIEGKRSDPDSKLNKRLDMLGCREFSAALSPRGKVGSWLVGHDSAVSINGYLFVHGGLNRDHGCMPLDDLNDRVRRELTDDGVPQAGRDIMLRRDGPQWNREFTLKPNDERRLELEEVLDYHHCTRMVVGHTPTSCIDPSRAGRIVPMYDERLYCIDTGIGKIYGGNLSALSVERGAASALYF